MLSPTEYHRVRRAAETKGFTAERAPGGRKLLLIDHRTGLSRRNPLTRTMAFTAHQAMRELRGIPDGGLPWPQFHCGDLPDDDGA